ncbi:MAG: NifU family protein [Flavobacteriales bacterium]|nr:NifU family protein [Flavobacteriales bacterium]|tara:strand:+ start:455 stop:1075 length:621 start_codon:yes stop_codon:yes gene_type:complete
MDKTAIAPHSIYAESTPNPATMKFVSNRYLIIDGQVYEYTLEDDASNSPLAEKLLNFPFVEKVFMASNFVAITKTDIIEWQDVIHQIRDFLAEFLNNGGVVIKVSALDQNAEEENSSNSIQTPKRESLEGIDAKIADILDEYIRPAVESDGGAIHFHSFEEGKVSVVLKGACSGCPSSTMTLKAGIENMLKEMLPGQIKEVEAING